LMVSGATLVTSSQVRNGDSTTTTVSTGRVEATLGAVAAVACDRGRSIAIARATTDSAMVRQRPARRVGFGECDLMGSE
jgi:hypothetical protein